MTARCFIPKTVLAAMCQEAEAYAPLETGGILLGTVASADVWIEELVSAGPKAIRGRTWFVPDHEYQEHAIAASYKTSCRRIEYLGDWHTHPGGSLALSKTDLATLRSIARHTQARQPHPVMAIVAGAGTWHFGVWRVDGPLRRLFKARVMQLVAVITE